MMVDMSDQEFLGYVVIHSKTPVAEFCADHVVRLFALAGEDPPRLRPRSIIALHYQGDRIARAKKRIECPRYQTCTAGLERTRTLIKAGP